MCYIKDPSIRKYILAMLFIHAIKSFNVSLKLKDPSKPLWDHYELLKILKIFKGLIRIFVGSLEDYKNSSNLKWITRIHKGSIKIFNGSLESLKDQSKPLIDK